MTETMKGEIKMANLETLTLKELRAMAKDAAVKNWWTMKKVDLIDALATTEPEEVKVEPNVNTLNEEKDVPEDEPAHVRKNQKRLIAYNGKTQTLNAWAKELGIRHQTLYNRIVMKGWDIEKAFEAPTKKEVTADVEGPTEDQ